VSEAQTDTTSSLRWDLQHHRRYKTSVGLLTFALDALARRTAIEEAVGLTDGGDTGSLIAQIRQFLNSPINKLISSRWREKAKSVEEEINKEDEELFNF
jgi:hypothetical protein